MNTETTAEPIVTNARESLLAAMMVFACAKQRHQVACKMLHANPDHLFLQIAHGMTVASEEAAYRAMLEEMLSWIDDGCDGFEQLVAPAQAWCAAEDALDASTEMKDEQQALDTFNVLAAACERVAGVVAAVN